MLALRLSYIFASAGDAFDDRAAGENINRADAVAERSSAHPIVGTDVVAARAAFDTLYRDMYPALIDFAYRYMRTADAAHDVVQEVFVALWMRREQWAPREGAAAYLYGAVRNRALATLARNGVAHRVDSQGEPLALGAIPDAPDAAVVRSDTSTILRRALETLPDRQRDAIVLHFGRGLTVAETARALGVSHTAATNLVTRALARLRAEVDGGQ